MWRSRGEPRETERGEVRWIRKEMSGGPKMIVEKTINLLPIGLKAAATCASCRVIGFLTEATTDKHAKG